MPIIDDTKFTGRLNLPHTGNSLGNALVDQFIADYEPEYLEKVLGYELYKAFTEGIDGSGTPDQRWVDLLEGNEFEYCDKLYLWKGFETSPIQNYVYYQFMDDQATNSTLIGQVVNNAENATMVSPVKKMVDAWNAMVADNNILYRFFKTYPDIYPEYDPCQYSNEVYHLKNQLGL